jgi:hypothetical protein
MNTDDDFEDLDATPTWEQIEEVLEEIKERCDAAKIEYEDDSNADENDISVTINMPCGRETRTIYLFDYDDLVARSEERRVGKECRRLCRSRWSPYH